MKKSVLKNTVLAFLLTLSSALVFAQEEMKLTSLEDEMVVNVSVEKAWEVLNSYGDVGSYHSGVTSSKPINNSGNEGTMNCERQCTIENGKKDIVVEEKIIEYEDGQYYRYEVTRFVNFPAKAFYNCFGVKTNESGQTVIYVKSDYRLKSGLMTWMAKGTLKNGNRDTLLAYKHYMETGEENADIKMLRKKYKKV